MDPSTQTLIFGLLPKLQVLGCQLLAQVSLTLGTKLIGFSTMILGTMSRTLSTYPVRSCVPVSSEHLSLKWALMFGSFGCTDQ